MESGTTPLPILRSRVRPDGRLAAVSWMLFGTTLALLAFAIALEAASGPDGVATIVSEGLVILSCAFVGLVVSLRRPRNLVGWIVLVNGFVLVFGLLASPYAYRALIQSPGSLPAGRWMALWNEQWPYLYAGVTALALVFPDGRLPSPRWRRVAIFAAVSFTTLTIAVLFSPGRFSSPFEHVASPLPQLPDSLQVVVLPFWLGTLASLFAAAWAVRTRLRRATGVERLQLLWFAYAALGIPLTLLACVADRLITGGVGALTLVPLTATLLAIPLAVGVAILRYRLFDIELAINRTLVYGTLTAAIVISYALLVAGLQELIPARGVPGLIAAGVIALAVQPLRLRLQRRADRLIYGDRSNPYAALSRLGERLHRTLPADEVAQTIVDSVAEALRLSYVAIEFAGNDAREPVAQHGRPGRGAASRIPLRYQQETVGELAVQAPAGRELAASDLRLLEDLANHAGVAIHAVRLTADLQRSRERLVGAREEERRRLRRDLHDGLGPTLAGAVLQLDAAQSLIAAQPARAGRLLAELREQTQDAIADVRRLVYELRPPALDELGLIDALREQAARLNHDGPAGAGAGGGATTVEIAAPDRLPALPAAVEVAAYRIVTEAMTNVTRHAGASRCDVRVTLDGDLRLEIADDGRGLQPAQPAGVGLQSMRERAAELGGSCSIAPRNGGGTVVHAILPVSET